MDPLRGEIVVVMEEEDEAEEVMEGVEDEAEEEAMVEAMIEEAEEGDEAEVEVEDNKIQGNQFTIFWSKLRFWDSHLNTNYSHLLMGLMLTNILFLRL